MKQNKYLTIQEVADELRISPQSVRDYIKKGIFQSIRVGKKYRILRNSYEEFTTASEYSPANISTTIVIRK